MIGVKNASIITLHITLALMLGLQSCGSSDKSSTSPITSKDVDEKKSSSVSVSAAENESTDIYADAMDEAEDVYSDAMKEAEDIYNEALEEAQSITDDEEYQKALKASEKSMEAATKAAKAAESGNVDDAMDAYKDAMDAYKSLGY